MIALGYWIETLSGSPFPAPQECVGEYSKEIRDKITDYLDSNRPTDRYRGYSWCRFGCGASPATMGAGEFTDGVWIWPEGLSHYVRHHSVVLPEEFTNWVLHKIPAPPFDGNLHDFTFWLEWGRQRKNKALRRNLQKHYHAHRRQALNNLRKLKLICVPAGPTNKNCLWVNCSYEAESGKAFCPYHMVSPHTKRMQLSADYLSAKQLVSALAATLEVRHS